MVIRMVGLSINRHQKHLLRINVIQQRACARAVDNLSLAAYTHRSGEGCVMTKKAMLTVRIDEDLKQALSDLADSERRSVSQQLMLFLEEGLRARRLIGKTGEPEWETSAQPRKPRKSRVTHKRSTAEK